MPKQQKSRLDREIDEILASKAKQPIDFQQRRRQLQQADESAWKSQTRTIWAFVTSSPLILAYILVGIALLIDSVAHPVSMLLCVTAVITIWLPGIRSLVRPNGGSKTEVKYWRGQAFVSEIK